MLRKCTDEDISDEECENVIDPFYDNYDSYLEEYVVPEVIAFYIASSFYRNAMWEATFEQHFNSVVLGLISYILFSFKTPLFKSAINLLYLST